MKLRQESRSFHKRHLQPPATTPTKAETSRFVHVPMRAAFQNTPRNLSQGPTHNGMKSHAAVDHTTNKNMKTAADKTSKTISIASNARFSASPQPRREAAHAHRIDAPGGSTAVARSPARPKHLPTRQSLPHPKIRPPLPSSSSLNVPCPVSVQQRWVERTDVGAGANKEQHHNQQALKVEDGRHGGREGQRGREEQQRRGTGRRGGGGSRAPQRAAGVMGVAVGQRRGSWSGGDRSMLSRTQTLQAEGADKQHATVQLQVRWKFRWERQSNSTAVRDLADVHCHATGRRMLSKEPCCTPDASRAWLPQPPSAAVRTVSLSGLCRTRNETQAHTRAR